MNIQLTVIGLNKIGVSFGLALKSQGDEILRIGNDISVGSEQKAVKMGAFDKAIHNIPASVEDADIVILCLPMDDVRKTLEIIAPIIKPGAVVLNTSPLNAAISSWSQDIFPEERYLISFFPNLNPEHIGTYENTIEQASDDLFQKGLFAISASAKTHPDAVRLASDLAGILGAQSYFADPYEIDGLTALVELLPKLSSAALMQAISKQPGWREACKVAGLTFFFGTESVNHFDEDKDLGLSALLNQENTIRVLQNFIDELQQLQDLLKNQDSDELSEYLTNAVELRGQWWRRRQTSDWDRIVEPPQLPTSGQMLGRMFGLGRLLKKDSSTDKK
jgi:prephenate dehydrogenase